uniref:LysR substrate-binding domain-containing protein n=1 Tax=uncultured Sphingomonas sp. TaxID=158754 RepID=UPI0035C99BB3
MRRQAPPLEATEAFLAAARAPSFRAAADEIALSPSAFSRRIQLLESFVGAALFDRSGPSVQLTDAGADYFADVAPAMDSIRRATMRIRDSAGSRTLRLVTSHSFAVSWLVPRLPDLIREHGIEIDLTIGRDAQSLTSGAADLAIWGGHDAEETLPRERLIALSAVLASAPRLADGRLPPACLAEVAGHRVLAAKAPEHFWRRWLQQMGQDDRDWQAVTRFETTQLTYEAAASGLGLTLAIPLISERFARERRLVPALGRAMPIGIDYTLFYATSDIARRAPVRAFVRWLHEMIAGSSDAFDCWVDAPAFKIAAVERLHSLQH